MKPISNRVLTAILATFLLLGSAANVRSETTGPSLGGDIIFRLGYNGVYDADAPLVETNDVFGVMIASPELRFGSGLILGTEIRFEALLPPDEDRFFEDEGFFLRELYLRYPVSDQLTLQFGKYAPSFALASLITPGMFGNNYNKELELIDRIAATAEFSFGANQSAVHQLSISTFFEDTSFLSGSLGFSRGTKDLSNGGPSNTENFESIAVSLTGSDFEALPGFTYKIGARHQAKGVDGVSDETAVVLAATRTLGLSNGHSLTWIGEIAPVWNVDGSDDDVFYASLGFAYQARPWTFIVTGTSRRRDLADGRTYDDYNFQTSVEYGLRNGFTLAFAHEFLRDQNIDSRRFGIRLSKVINLARN